MSKTQKTPVTSTEVRAWLTANGLNGERGRGRLGSAKVAAYNAANPTRKYRVTYSVKAPEAVKVTAVVSRNGRKTPITRKVVLSDARKALRAAGEPVGARGIIPTPMLQKYVASLTK
jgi:hypothetical protein